MVTETAAPIRGTDAYWRQRRLAFALIQNLERAIRIRNQAPMYVGSADDPIENIGPWDRVCQLQDRARLHPLVLETLAAQKRLTLLTA
ncbi:hypothetical protein SAMN05880556_12336 [Azospirillum sp. RU38E]|nr:hypothetical protein SAMN05880556_12336 [Azospirillum sp. RU38E]SNT25378.1 hypothetical protein SAMN05880591_12436 [Azospirillum sp. RU37A]